jgi:hypothetical protein
VACRHPIDEQLDGREPQRLGGVKTLRRRRGLEWLQAADVLPLDAERLTTGCENVHASRTLRDRDHQTRNGVDHVRAIVQNEQHARVTQSGNQTRERVFGIEVDVNGSSDRAEDESRVGQLREVDVPDAIHVSADQPLGGGHRDGGLADPAGSDNGDQPLRGKPALQPGDEIIASNQRCEASRQVVLGRRGARGRDRRRGTAFDCDIRDKPVTLPRARGQVAAAFLPIMQRPPQCGDLEFQVSFDDMGAGPCAGDQLILAEQFARPFEQSSEEIKGAAAHANGLARLEQEPLLRK